MLLYSIFDFSVFQGLVGALHGFQLHISFIHKLQIFFSQVAFHFHSLVACHVFHVVFVLHICRAVPGAMDRASISALSAAQIMHLIIDLITELIQKLQIPVDSDAVIEIRIPRTVLERVSDSDPADLV